MAGFYSVLKEVAVWLKIELSDFGPLNLIHIIPEEVGTNQKRYVGNDDQCNASRYIACTNARITNRRRI